MRILFMRVSKLRSALHLLLFLVVCHVSVSRAQPNGEQIFKANCASCHTVGKGKLIGPDLAGVEERTPGKEWLVKWIRNSRELIGAGDAYANKIFEEYNKTDMPAQAVTVEDIDAILAYIKVAEAKAAERRDTISDLDPTRVAAKDDNTLLYVLWISVIGLLLAIWFLTSTKRALRSAVADRTGIPAPQDLGIWASLSRWMGNNKRAVAVIVLLIVALGLRQAWYGIIWIGVHQGYEPLQPIAFPHDLHAGKNGINCVYCHSGAEKGKTAGIPSLNVCMNCHSYVKEGERSGSTEINKIYAYLDYDPETQKYGGNPKPVEWVRVHNLPDLAYFNHSQHVKVGKLECQTCHGPVEEMAVLRQENTLVMGWCVDCHRNEPVKMEGNAFYDEVHAKLSEAQKTRFLKDNKITVEELGGLECARCHY